jgi:hypothetical protein
MGKNSRKRDEATMKTFIALGLAALALGGCTDTITMRDASGATDACTYTLMYRSLKQCVANHEADGYAIADGPSWWTFYR